MSEAGRKIAIIAPETGLEAFLKKHGVSEILYTQKTRFYSPFRRIIPI